MTWSSDGLQYTYTETTESGDTITYVDTYDTAYAAPGSKITATSWSDTNGNSSSISWSTASKTFDYDGNKSTTETTQTVLVESGTSTWTYVDDNSQTQTKTLTFEHYFDNATSWNHLGGFERDEDDVTTYFTAGFTEAYKVRSVSSITTQLDSDDGIEYSLYNNAKFVSKTSTGWNGQDLVETTFYDATTGDVVGRSVKNIDTWTMGDETVTSTNTHYEDADGGWLGNKWSDSNGNQGSYYSETYDGSESGTDILTEVAGFDLDGDGTPGESTQITTYKDPNDTNLNDGITDITISSTNTVRVERGEDTWSYTDMNNVVQTETRTYTHYYDSNWVHLGGVEVIDGETVKWGANWTFVGVEKDTSSLAQLSDTSGYADMIAYKLFGDVYYDTETWLGWNGLAESETTYYHITTDEKVGSSFTSTNSWTTPDGTSVTSTNTSYNDADWNYLGNEWSEGSNGGWNFEKKLTVDVTEPVADDPKPAISLDGNTTAGETLTQVKIANEAALQSISSSNAVIVREGQDQFSFKDMNNQTVTEDIIYKHYYYDANGDGYWQDSEHIGGYEIRNGETVIYEAGFQQGEKKRDVTSINDVLSEGDGIAYDLYGAAKYIEDTRLGWNGETEIETTYYSTSGAELGRSFTNINKWTDYFSNQQVTSTNTHYEDADGGWLGNKWSDSNGNQGSYYSETYDGSESGTDILTEVAGFDLDGDGTPGESTQITTYKDPNDTNLNDGITDITISSTNTVRVERGEDTWSYTDMNNVVQAETRTYTHYYDSNWVHLGGVEVIDGETVKWGANWTFVGVEKDTSSLAQLSDTSGYADMIAYKLFGDVYYDTETWLGWNGLAESETTYYHITTDEKVGSSFTSTNSWTTPDGTSVTSTNTSYNDADWNYLGNEWSEGSNGGWNFEKKLTVDVTEPVADDPKPAISLDGNTTAGETLTQVKIANEAALQSISSSNAVIVREGQDQFSFKDMNNQTVTEDIIYKHYYYDANGDGYWQDSEHIGGYEIRNGETVIYEAGFQQGEKKRDVTSINDVLSEGDGIAYDLYGAAKYIEDTRLGWNGETEIETTYYSTSGAELGRSFTNINKWTDYFSNQQVTSTNTHYEDADGGWLGNKWSDSNGNQGSYYSETYDGSESGTDILTEVAGFDLDGDGTPGESTQITTYKDPNDTNLNDGITDITISSTNTVRVERGEDTWSYTDMNNVVQAETRTYTHYYDSNWVHLGGVEVIDGETVKWGANWTFVGVEKDTSSLAQLSDTSGYADMIAYKLFGDVYYDTETWLGWNGLAESETTYYHITTDEKVGSSFTSTNSWTTPDGTSVTSTNTSYNDADWNYLGNEWSEGSNGGWNFEKKLTVDVTEPVADDPKPAISLDGNTTAGETLTQVKIANEAALQSISSSNAVIVREGQDQFSFKDMNNQTVTEDIIYKHYYYDANGDGYWQDSEHIGGYEIRNGETVIYEAGFQQGAKKKSLSDEPALTSSVDSVGFSIFDDASYTQGVAYDAVERDSWTGFKEVETTYYDKATGAEIGRSFKMESQYSDPARGTISSENTHYESVDGTFLGNKYSDEDASGNILNSGSRIEKIETITTEPAWLDFDGDTSKGETSITGIELRVETGSDTWSFMQGSTLVSETREYTHYFDKDTFEHLGGSEVVNGVTEKIGPNWTPLGTQVSTTSLASMSTLSSGDFAYTFYDAAKYEFDASSGETIYYDAADGSILGRSFENSGVSLTRGGQTFTATEIDYRGPRDEFYGSKWYDTAVSPSKYGQDIEYRTTLSQEPVYVDFDGNGTAGEYIAGGREVRIEERSETIDGNSTTSLRYFDVNSGIMLGGVNSAGQGSNIYTTVILGDGSVDSKIYGPTGALTLEQLLGVSSWSNPTNVDLSQALSDATSQFNQERVAIQDVFAADGTTVIGGKSVGSTFTLELTGTGITFEGMNVVAGTITSASLSLSGSELGSTTSLDLPAELIGLIFQTISASGEQSMQIEAIPSSNIISVANSSLSDTDGHELRVQIEDGAGNTLVVHGAYFTTSTDGQGHPINGSFDISFADLDSAINYAISAATNTTIWNANTVITKIKIFEDKNFNDTAENFEKSASLDWSVFQQAEASGVMVTGADYTLTPSHNIQSVIDGARDVDGDGSIIIALTSGRYTQDFTINDSIEIWGSAQGLAISADGSDADGKVDEISEVKFDLADNVRGVGETWIDGRVTVASDGVKLDGLRLHDADGALVFAGSDIDQFELYNSYVTGFNGANSIRYSDTDGTKSNGWVIDGNLIGGVTGGVGGSLYLTGLEHSVIEDNVFWRPGAAHIYLEDMHYLNVKDNFFVQGLHADGANSDGLLNAIQTSTFGYGGFASGYGYGYGYGGPQGAVSDATASYANQSYDFYGRNYVAEVKGNTNGVVFDGNTAKYNSGGIQFWDEDNTSNFFTNTEIRNNVFTDFENADPDGYLATVSSRHKSGIMGGVTFSVSDGSASSNLKIEGNSFTGSIGEIYNADDVDSLILIQGEVANVDIAHNDLDWDGSNTYLDFPNDTIYTQGIHIAGDVNGGRSTGLNLRENIFDTDTPHNYRSDAILLDLNDYSSLGLGQLSSTIAISGPDFASLVAYQASHDFGRYSDADANIDGVLQPEEIGDHGTVMFIGPNGANPTITFNVSTQMDTTPPDKPSIDTIFAYGATTDTTPTIQGSSEAGAVIRVLESSSLIGTTTADGSGQWAFTPSTAFSAGSKSITVTATDTAGNTSPSSDPFVFQIDVAGSLGSVDGNNSNFTLKYQTIKEHENGAYIGEIERTSNPSDALILSKYWETDAWFRVEGQSVYLADDYHFDFDPDMHTLKLVKYSLGTSTGDYTPLSWSGWVNPPLLSLKLSSDQSDWDQIELKDGGSEIFQDVPEAIHANSRSFDGYTTGAVIADLSSTVITHAYGLHDTTMFEINASNQLKLKDSFYYDPQQNVLIDTTTGYFYDITASGNNTLNLISYQTASGDINFVDEISVAAALSGAQVVPIPYTAGAPISTKQLSSDANVNALLFETSTGSGETSFWANDANYSATGRPTNITYSFIPQDSSNFAPSQSQPTPGTDAIDELKDSQKAAVRLALEEWENVANIEFIEVQETGDAAGTFRFGFTDYVFSSAAAWAIPPTTTPQGGDVWIQQQSYDYDYTQGSGYGFALLLHEIGHALGLKHPFEGSPQLSTALDMTTYSVMSYTNDPNVYAGSDYVVSSTPMVLDIAAIQHLYGAAEHNNGDTTYTYSPATAFAEAIWDSGGTDTLNIENFTVACDVDLTPGASSTIAISGWSMEDNLGIAQGTVIENVICGTGDDTILGNTANNVINGGAGADTITGGGGDDEFVFIESLLSTAVYDTVKDFSTGDTIKLKLDQTTDASSVSVAVTFVNSNADTQLSVNGTGEILAILEGVNSFNPTNSLIIDTITIV